jgi:hypothetical protein
LLLTANQIKERAAIYQNFPLPQINTILFSSALDSRESMLLRGEKDELKAFRCKLHTASAPASGRSTGGRGGGATLFADTLRQEYYIRAMILDAFPAKYNCMQ